jgi:hypothetical protein
LIANALRQLGASPITKRTFVLPAAEKCSIADLQRVLVEIFNGGDQVLVIGDSGRGMTGTALICVDTNEGVSVRNALGPDGVLASQCLQGLRNVSQKQIARWEAVRQPFR